MVFLLNRKFCWENGALTFLLVALKRENKIVKSILGQPCLKSYNDLGLKRCNIRKTKRVAKLLDST